ncbi:hypothetical protein HMPREF1556_00066 [Porphyromonas sp. oral taxon 278 str. W7784]|nr:hypothetical protein HMPREF1556_00066 [Porphyromonas sp. oral taxon 278 str. W7784]
MIRSSSFLIALLVYLGGAKLRRISLSPISRPQVSRGHEASLRYFSPR